MPRPWSYATWSPVRVLPLLVLSAAIGAWPTLGCWGRDDDDAADDGAFNADDDDSDDDDDDANDGGVRQVVDLSLGEVAAVTLSDGHEAIVKLLDTASRADDIRGAVRESTIQVEVNGEAKWIECGNYTLPEPIGGVRADCPVSDALYINSDEDRWGLRKNARVRLWPMEGRLFDAEEFVYPVLDQRWLANRSQSGNEPTDDYLPFWTAIYYHSGTDIGGVDALDRVVAAVAGRIVLANGQVLPGYEGTPAVLQQWAGSTRTDVVFIEDDRGRLYRYSHLDRTVEETTLGRRVEAGELIGFLGNGGASGGWPHLHFEIEAMQPSGLWGAEEAYVYLWEAYADAEGPAVIAVARPHRYAETGETVMLDGSKSVAFLDEIASYEWEFTDGETASGATVERTYDQPGFYTELLKVTDAEGRTAYDFATVQIVHAGDALPMYTYMHVAHSPSKDVRVGEDVVFKARVFGIGGGKEDWDFGDGSPHETTQSGNWPFAGDFAAVTHAYSEPGDYLVRVERFNERGEPAVVRLWVPVRE
ncbi:MAG: PKD domain-containing protein [Deltaproteobacteria bacterium]|nr:PKD domain-containing protein [Deltaproteobacteria bacterium]